MASLAKLPVIDMSAPDRSTAAKSIREACVDYGFFYAVGHGLEQSLIDKVLDQSKKFFSLPLHSKLNYLRTHHRGYTALFDENFNQSASSSGDPKESFYIGPLSADHLNQWPSPELLPEWMNTMKTYYDSILSTGKNLISLIALALDLDETHFERIGALNVPQGYLRLLHYPVKVENHSTNELGCFSHSDYGMITLLTSDGVPGLQVCRDKEQNPRLWEDVAHLQGALIVNIGDLMERWTNCLFRSTLHRVVRVGEERFSVAFFLEPDPDCVVEAFESCCDAARPKRYPPILSGDYLQQRLASTYKS